MTLPLRLHQLKDKVLQRPNQISFEFFPAKTQEAEAHLMLAIDKLAQLKPDFMTVTYGAGGSTRVHTAKIADYIQRHTGIQAAAHITSVNATKAMIHDVLREFKEKNITKVIALRGDMPGFIGDYVPTPDGYAYAKDLVAGIAALKQFDISVAGYPETHPQAKSEADDLRYLKDKVEAGASQIITQYCFDTDQVLRYIDKVKSIGITVPVVPGIMLIAHVGQLVKFSKQCGATVPQWLLDVCTEADQDPQLRLALSVYVAAEQCRILMEAGVDKFHFYCLNRFEAAYGVSRLLGMKTTS